MTQTLVQIEVKYGSTRYLVNLYGARIGKIYAKFLDKGKPIWIKLDAGTPVHDAVKKKAMATIAEFKEDRKKK